MLLYQINMLSSTRLCFLLFFMRTSDAVLSLCDTPSGYLEVQEGKQNNTFICSGQVNGLNVLWSLNYSSNDIGICYSNTTCTARYPAIFSLRRTAVTATLIVNETASARKDLFTTNLVCGTYSGTTKSNEIKCPVDLINLPETSSCSLQIMDTTWALIGQCDVSKVQSARGRYYCLLYQNSQPDPTLLGNFSMSTSPMANTNYSTGNCQIHTSLPPEGNFTYTVVIVPGEVRVSPSFTGSSEIRSPSGSPAHNCQQYLQESLGLSCYCNASDFGAPRGSVVWNGYSSSELKTDSVNRALSGMNFTCTLMWNNTAVRNVTYSPIVNYSSSVLSFKMADTESSVVEVRENENVSIACKADGRPLPTIRLLKVSDGDSQTVAEANSTRDLVHTLAQVRCESAATYMCQSENIVRGDERRTNLTVTCAPRESATSSDNYTATFKGEEATLAFQMISRPVPKELSIFYIGPLANDTALKTVEPLSGVEFQCNLLKLYLATCTVTLRNKANFNAGFYSAVFKNSLGNLSFIFEIKEGTESTTLPIETLETSETSRTTENRESSKGDSSSSSQLPFGAGLGVGLGVACVILLVLVVFIVRQRRRSLQRPETQRNRLSDTMTSTESSEQMKAPENNYDPMPLREVASRSSSPNLVGENTYSETEEGRQSPHLYEVPEFYENIGAQLEDTVYQNPQ